MSNKQSKKREDIISRMEEIMGRIIKRKDSKVEVELIKKKKVDNVIRKRIRYKDQPGSWIPAYLIEPAEKNDSKLPALICMHQTTPEGSLEPAGVSGKPNLHYALELAKRGYVTLAPDLPSFGDLKDVNPLPEGYVSGTMKDINLHRRGLDLLINMPKVDSERLGSIGHSLGGHNTLFLAALDTRVKVAATSCGFTSWKAYAENAGDLSAWAQDRYMPKIRDVYHNNPKEVPVLFEEILEAILPRAIYVNAPIKDAGMPKSGVDVCMKYIDDVTRKQNIDTNILVEHPDCGHDFPPIQREHCYSFIDKVLHLK